MIDDKHTKQIKRNIPLYYIYQFFWNMEFHAGNWVFFYLIFMNYQQLGLFDTICFTFGMLMEIPTGALADKFGRKFSIVAGALSGTFGIFALTLGGSFRMMLFGYLFISLGWALFSGAGEALVYDSLKNLNKEKDYDKVISKSTTIGMITLIIATLLGAWLFTIKPMYPHLFWGFGYLGAFITSLFFIEPKIQKNQTVGITDYLKQYADGFKVLAKPSLLYLVPLALIFEGGPYMFNAGLLRPSMATFQGYNQAQQSIIMAIAVGISALLAFIFPYVRKIVKDESGLFVASSLVILAFILGGIPLGILGFIPILILASFRGLTTPWLSTVVNDHTPSNDRATTLSSIALITKIPYVFLAYISGTLINEGFTNYVTWGVAFLLVVLLFIAWRINGKNLEANSSHK